MSRVGTVTRKAKRFIYKPYCDPLDKQINDWFLTDDNVVDRDNIQIFPLSSTESIIMYNEFSEGRGNVLCE